MNIKLLLSAIHCNLSLCTHNEIINAIELISRVQDMTNSEIELIKALYENGPLDDGDIPSSKDRDILLAEGFISKRVIKGKNGYNACTHRGQMAYNLLKTMY